METPGSILGTKEARNMKIKIATKNYKFHLLPYIELFVDSICWSCIENYEYLKQELDID